MTRKHRFSHRMVWPALAFLLALSFTMALALRPPPDVPQAAQEHRP